MPKKRISRLLFPSATIVLGVLCIFTKSYSHSIAGPVTEGPLVSFVGVLFCAFGLWGFIATVRELKRNEDDTTHPQPGPDFDV